MPGARPPMPMASEVNKLVGAERSRKVMYLELVSSLRENGAFRWPTVMDMGFQALYLM